MFDWSDIESAYSTTEIDRLKPTMQYQYNMGRRYKHCKTRFHSNFSVDDEYLLPYIVNIYILIDLVEYNNSNIFIHNDYSAIRITYILRTNTTKVAQIDANIILNSTK